MGRSLAALMVLAVIAGCASRPLPETPVPLASLTPGPNQPSAAVSPSTSAPPGDREQLPPAVPAEVGYVGVLTRFCDLGACCPAVDVAGTWYSLRLPRQFRWHFAESRYALRDRQDAARIAIEGDTVFVRGEEAGPDFCFATGLEHSIDVVDIAPAYVGGVLRTGVCLVLSTEDQLLEMKYPDGWDYDLVDGRMVVRDAERRVVLGEGDRIAVIATPEREATGSFCMVGDDMIRVSRIIAVWDA